MIGRKSAAIVFVDFSKVLDSINREEFFHILKLYGIPPASSYSQRLYDFYNMTLPTQGLKQLMA
jgi:hypothetical protein